MFPDALILNPSSNLPALCDAIANLCYLKTIRIRWSSLRDGTRHAKPRHVYCRQLLLPVVWLRARVPGLRIEIEAGRRMCQYDGGRRKSWDSFLGIGRVYGKGTRWFYKKLELN